MGGLEPFTSYTLRVRAQNAVGCSLSEAQAFQTAPAAPSSPQGLHLQHASPAALSLAWQPPASDHGSPLTGYQLEWARGSRTSGLPANAWRPAYQGTATEAQVGVGVVAGPPGSVPLRVPGAGCTLALVTASLFALHPLRPPFRALSAGTKP